MSTFSISINSRVLMSPVDVTILMPEPDADDRSLNSFYRSGTKYRVLWLLHGAGSFGDRNQWLISGNLFRCVEKKKIMVVMPSALNSDYANHPEFANGYNYTDFFFDELMPLIYGWLPASDKREDNYISGMSMGGSGALLLGFLHPEKFGGIAPISSSLRESAFLKGYENLTSAEFRELAMKDPKQFPTEYGDPEEGITLKEINMIAKYPTVQDYLDSYECMWERFPEIVEKGNLPRMFFSFGTKEVCYEKVLEFREYAESLGATDIVYDINIGYEHDFSLWDISLPKVLDWMEQK